MIIQFSNEVVGQPSILAILVSKKDRVDMMTIKSSFVVIDECVMVVDPDLMMIMWDWKCKNLTMKLDSSRFKSSILAGSVYFPIELKDGIDCRCSTASVLQVCRFKSACVLKF